MKRLLPVIAILVCAVLLCDPVFAAETIEIPMPDKVEIEKKTDLSARILAGVIGPAWTTFTGNIEDGLNSYETLGSIFSILMGALNLAALVFLSCGILYMWGVFALTTAHEGKKLGGSVYNSLWVPVRTALSFSLCIPVSHGFSLLQIAFMTMIGFSINFANLAWDTAGKYIAEVNIGVKDIGNSNIVVAESRALIEPMFRNALMYEIATKSAGAQKDTSLPVEDNEKTKKYYSGDNFYVIINKTEGQASIYMTKTDMNTELNEFGVIIVPWPKMPDEYKGDNAVVYDAQKGLAITRINEVVKLWGSVQKWAAYYASINNLLGNNKVGEPAQDGKAMVDLYDKNVSQAMNDGVRKIQQGSIEQKELIASSLDNKDGKSTIGWATAGIFSYPITQALARIEKLTISEPVNFTAHDILPSRIRLFMDNQLGQAFETAHRDAIARADNFVADKIMNGSTYKSATADGEDDGVIGKLVMSLWNGLNVFRDDSAATTISEDKEHGGRQIVDGGILADTLNKFSAHDPIIVITEFGSRMYHVGACMVAASTAAGAGGELASNFAQIGLRPAKNLLTSFVVGVGKFATSQIFTMIAFILFSIGILMKYIAPLSPLAIWMYAFLGWILKVLEALIAAPLWAVSHAMPEGTGFAGNSARQGYILCMDIALRPILMVTGAVMSIVTWKVAGGAFAEIITRAMNAFTLNDKDFDTQIILAIMVVVLFWYLYVKIFTALIFTFPDRVMSWIGKSGGGSLISADEAGKTVYGAMVTFSGQVEKRLASLSESKGFEQNTKGLLHDKDKEKADKEKAMKAAMISQMIDSMLDSKPENKKSGYFKKNAGKPKQGQKQGKADVAAASMYIDDEENSASEKNKPRGTRIMKKAPGSADNGEKNHDGENVRHVIAKKTGTKTPDQNDQRKTVYERPQPGNGSKPARKKSNQIIVREEENPNADMADLNGNNRDSLIRRER